MVAIVSNKFDAIDSHHWVASTTTGVVLASPSAGGMHMFLDVLDGTSNRQLTLPRGRWMIRCKWAGFQVVTAKLEMRGDFLGSWKAGSKKSVTIEIGLDSPDTIQFSHVPLEIQRGPIPS